MARPRSWIDHRDRSHTSDHATPAQSARSLAEQISDFGGTSSAIRTKFWRLRQRRLRRLRLSISAIRYEILTFSYADG